MIGMAIVALPERDDRVWKVSSEKVPHMTLLFLGDQSSNSELSSMTEYVKHAADTSLRRFGMAVDRRGVLGDKNADVLFFEKFRDVDLFRYYLLQNSAIKKAFDSVPQFPEFTPHLTLGFPETPAKEIKDDWGIHWVTFDRIAFWTGDFSGPEFLLKRTDDMVMQSTIDAGEEFLEHFGVKGMRWGVRKQRTSGSSGPSKSGKSSRSGGSSRAEVKLKKKIAAHEAVIKSAKARIKNHEDAMTDLNNNGIRSALMQRLYGRSLDSSNFVFASVYGISKETALRNLQVQEYNNFKMEQALVNRTTKRLNKLKAKQAKLNHDGFSEEDLEAFLTHIDKEEADELKHFGVKGMRWGVRKSTSAGSGHRAIPVASEHASAQAAKAKAKAGGGPKVLTNQEIQQVLQRAQLEGQFKSVNAHWTQKGAKLVIEILTGVGKSQITRVANDQATAQIKKAMDKSSKS